MEYIFKFPAKFGIGKAKFGGPGYIHREMNGQGLTFFEDGKWRYVLDFIRIFYEYFVGAVKPEIKFENVLTELQYYVCICRNTMQRLF